MTNRSTRLFWTRLLPFAVIGVFAPGMTHAVEPLAAPPAQRSADKVLDVRLDGWNRLCGALFTETGHPLIGVPAVLHGVRQGAVGTLTGQGGEFHFDGVLPGAYRLRVGGEQMFIVRVWEPKAAPPNAPERLLVIADTTVTRGQRRVSEILTLDDKLVVGGMVAAAIAIPIAIANSDKDVVPISP